MKLVEVTWSDSAAVPDGEYAEEKFDKPLLGQRTAVGYVVRDWADEMVLAQTRVEDGDAVRYTNILIIPSSSIISEQELQRGSSA